MAGLAPPSVRLISSRLRISLANCWIGGESVTAMGKSIVSFTKCISARLGVVPASGHPGAVLVDGVGQRHPGSVGEVGVAGGVQHV